jgi:hypothetical protein
VKTESKAPGCEKESRWQIYFVRCTMGPRVRHMLGRHTFGRGQFGREETSS